MASSPIVTFIESYNSGSIDENVRITSSPVIAIKELLDDQLFIKSQNEE